LDLERLAVRLSGPKSLLRALKRVTGRIFRVSLSSHMQEKDAYNKYG
jgi:hypothetical protein